jgi:hypothetical protein
MKYYSYSQSLSQTYRKPPRSKPAIVSSEPIPKTIDQLDVLLTIWIAEAILGHESLTSKRAKRVQRKRSPAR